MLFFSRPSQLNVHTIVRQPVDQRINPLNGPVELASCVVVAEEQRDGVGRGGAHDRLRHSCVEPVSCFLGAIWRTAHQFSFNTTVKL